MRLLVLWEAVSLFMASYATSEAILAYPDHRCYHQTKDAACARGSDRFAVWLFFSTCLWTYFFFPLCVLFFYRLAQKEEPDDDIVLV
ncbi:hypothetical protein EBZ80_03520 [bacterium]|nr:hypothetical protein [bacterium]